MNGDSPRPELCIMTCFAQAMAMPWPLFSSSWRASCSFQYSSLYLLCESYPQALETPETEAGFLCRTGALFESDPLLAALRICPFWIASGTCTVGYAFWSSTRRTLRAPLVVGYTLMTAGLVGLAFLQPDASTRTVVFTGLVGVGFAAPLILLVSLVQLTSPHALIATATAVLTSSRAIAAAVFTAAFGAAVSSQTAKWIPGKVPAAAIAAGLDPQYAGQFTGALANQEQAAIAAIPGITPAIIGAGVAALKQALSNSFRVVYIIAASFGVVGIVLCYFVPNLASTMHFGVDAPVEELHSRHHRAADAPVAGEEK